MVIEQIPAVQCGDYFSREKLPRATPGAIAGGHRSAGTRLFSRFSWIISFNLPNESILLFAPLTDDQALAELMFEAQHSDA